MDWTHILWSKLDRVFNPFDATSLLTLISVSIDSPTCGQCIPSLSILWTRAIARPPRGFKIAQPFDLPRLLTAARNAAPQLQLLEDFWAPDPRLIVRHSVNKKRFRIHPGTIIDAPQVLRTAKTTAEAIDDFILNKHGFTLSDLLEVGLSYSDWRLSLLSPNWPSEAEFPNKDDLNQEHLRERVQLVASMPIPLSEKEINAISDTEIDPERWISICMNPQRAAAAWEWATISSRSLRIQLAPMTQSFGAVLAIESPNDGIAPVPAAFVISAIAAATAILAQEAADDIQCIHKMQTATKNRISTLLGVSSNFEVEGQGLSYSREGILAIPGDRHGVAISIATGLDLSSLEAAVDKVSSALANLNVNSLRDMGAPFEQEASLCRLVLYYSPYVISEILKKGVVFLHIEEFANYLLDAQQTEAGIDLIWQYLDELSTVPITDIANVDPSDIWKHWKSHGILDPIGFEDIKDKDIVLVIEPSVDDHIWRTASNWESIEAILYSAELPSVMSWSSARLDDFTQAMFANSNEEVLLVNTDPPLIVSTLRSSELSSLGIDPTFAIGIADGILLTCINFSKVASGIILPNSKPLMIRLEFTSKRIPGIGLRVSKPPNFTIDLLLGSSWLESLIDDPKLAHEHLGEILVHGLDELNRPIDKNGWITRRESFLSAWRESPPIATLHTAETVLPIPKRQQIKLPRNHVNHAKAWRLLNNEITAHEIPEGVYKGVEEVKKIYLNMIVPILNKALTKSLANWSPRAILTVVNFLNDAYGERERVNRELEYALAGPGGEQWRKWALSNPDGAEYTRPLELVIEFLLSAPLNGLIIPDRFDVAEVTELANIILRISLTLSGFQNNLQDITLNITKESPLDWKPKVEITEDLENTKCKTVRFNLDAYIEADRSYRFRTSSATDLPTTGPIQLESNLSRHETAFIPLEKLNVPQSLLKASEEMRIACGTGIDGLIAVLGTAASWTPGEDKVVLIQREELLDAAQAWSSLSTTEIETALGRLTLDGDQLNKEGINYWEQERRSYRLAIRPLIKFEQSLIIIPQRIMATQNVYFQYLYDGRIPNSSDLPKEVTEAFSRFRQVANKKLERDAAAVATSLGLPYRGNLHEKQASEFGLVIPGEIDLLVADPVHYRLWVCEVKDISIAFSPSTIRTGIDKFYNKDYVIKLLKKAEAVKNNTIAAAKLLSVFELNKEWRVIPLMITRRIEPAAFVDNIAAAFTVIDNLTAVFEFNNDPKLGYNLQSS